MEETTIADKCYTILKINGVMRVIDLILYFRRLKINKLNDILDNDNRFRKIFDGFGLVVWKIKKDVNI